MSVVAAPAPAEPDDSAELREKRVELLRLIRALIPWSAVRTKP